MGTVEGNKARLRAKAQERSRRSQNWAARDRKEAKRQAKMARRRAERVEENPSPQGEEATSDA